MPDPRATLSFFWPTPVVVSANWSVFGSGIDPHGSRIAVPSLDYQVGGKLIEGDPKWRCGVGRYPSLACCRSLATRRWRIDRSPADHVFAHRGSRFGVGELEALTNLRIAIIEMMERPSCACTTCATPMPRWRAGRRRPSAAPEDDGPRVDHRHRTHIRRSLRRRTRRRRLGAYGSTTPAATFRSAPRQERRTLSGRILAKSCERLKLPSQV